MANRMEIDQRLAATKLPRNTRYIDVDGCRGWVYQINDCLGGKPYTFFAYFDDTFYQVVVVSPEVENVHRNIHDCHLYPTTGRICFGSDFLCGMPSLEMAYGKSCLWAAGYTSFVETGKFQFSNNNF